jgi:DNA-binding transcriptional LysR family regulator
MRGLHHVTYRHDVLVVMSPNHPLAGSNELHFADTLESDYVGLHTASSINALTHSSARQTGKPLSMRIHVPGFDAVCRMVQAGMGIGVIPHAVFEALGKPLGLVGIALSDAWAKRELRIVVRDPAALSPVTRLLFDYLGGVEP